MNVPSLESIINRIKLTPTQVNNIQQLIEQNNGKKKESNDYEYLPSISYNLQISYTPSTPPIASNNTVITGEWLC